MAANRLDELYLALSSRITAHVISQETSDWPTYFKGLRTVAIRVLSESTDSGLTAAEQTALIQRISDHISELERVWPTLKPKRTPTEPE
jgi:hypothetical protein